MIRNLFIALMATALLSPVSAQTPFSQLPVRSGLNTGPSHTADTLAWKADVVANGGVAPSEATLTAVDVFVTAVIGVKSQLIWIDLMAPDNLIACKTPLYHTSGNDPLTSTATGFSTAGYAVQNQLAITGLDPSVVFSTSDMGLIVYANNSGGAPQIAFGGGNGGTCAQLYGTGNGNYFLASYSAWSINASSITVSTGDFVYFSAQRTGTTSLNYYIANGNNAWASHGTSAGASGSPPAGSGNNSIGWESSGLCATVSPSTLTVSFMGVTHGMSSADSQTLYNAVQAFRTAIGGGKT